MQQENEFLQAGDRGKLFYTKTFSNGDKIFIQITSLRGFANGTVQYYDETGIAAKKLFYSVSQYGNTVYAY